MSAYQSVGPIGEIVDHHSRFPSTDIPQHNHKKKEAATESVIH